MQRSIALYNVQCTRKEENSKERSIACLNINCNYQNQSRFRILSGRIKTSGTVKPLLWGLNFSTHMMLDLLYWELERRHILQI